MTNLSCSYGLQLFLRLCAMSADLKGAVLRKLGDEPRWAGLRFRRELPLWLTEISAVLAYNPMHGGTAGATCTDSYTTIGFSVKGGVPAQNSVITQKPTKPANNTSIE